MESGIAGPGHQVFCNGVIKLGNSKFHCWRQRYGGHGLVDMKQAIAQSCDIYFYDLARRLGVDRIGAMARRFGLGESFAIEAVGERSGLVPSKDWKLAVTGVPWQLGETLITGIGQGFLLATPLQLAVMTARLANGGMAVMPKLSRRRHPEGEGEAAKAAAEDGQAEDGGARTEAAGTETIAQLGLRALDEVNKKQILLYHTDASVQGLLQSLGFDASLPDLATLDDEQIDFALPAFTNIGANKTDRYMQTDLSHHTQIYGDGSIVDSMTITRTHTFNDATFAWLADVTAQYGFTAWTQELRRIARVCGHTS